MNRTFLILIICCAIPLLLVILFIFGNNQIGSPKSQNPSKPVESGLKQGDVFPDFSVSEVGGKTITNDSLRGKPAIVWFTTSWCIPCQIGAQDVSKLDNQLGGEAFNVLVVFVDPKETDSDLILWRKRFASPDWMVAFDNKLTNLASKVNLKFLDSKFLLDKNGIIKNIDFQIADERYLGKIEQAAQEN